MIFKQIRWKNFFSYGKQWTEINLDQSQLIGIYGKNGNGKSCLTHALSFVTTGKAFRGKIKKSQIVNSRNKKNCIVELVVQKGKDTYLIRRGIKPDIFEIIKNDIPLEETAHVKDFQIILEQIFRFNPKVLKNTLFMSSMSYTPFLLFSASEKREYIENILNLQIFGDMTDNLKIDMSIIKKEIIEIEQNYILINKEIDIITEMNDIIKKNQNANKTTIDSEITKLKENIQILLVNIQKNKKNIQQNQIVYDKKQKKFLSGIDDNDSKQLVINSKISTLNTQINQKNSDINKENSLQTFFENNSNCNTCKQQITDEHKKNIKEDINKRILIVDDQIKNIFKIVNGHKKSIQKIKETRKKIEIFGEKNQKFNDEEILSLVRENINLNSDKNSSENLIKNHQQNLKNINNKQVLKDVSKKIIKKKEVNEKLNGKKDKEHIISLSKNLLSDKGIKLFIIKKYIPFLNKFVNMFLDIMNASYRIQFNEELQEKIILKGYENLSYFSLSSGEQQRCDLALLFSFLKIAKMKNSFYTNILILDEIIGHSLDADGITGVINILQNFKSKGMTIFIISHMDQIKSMTDKNFYADKKIFSKLQEE